MQGGGRSRSNFWLLMELDEARHTQRTGMLSAGKEHALSLDINWSEPPHEGVLMLGMLNLPTLSGGVQRWNR